MKLQIEHIKNYYDQHKLSQKGIDYQVFLGQCQKYPADSQYEEPCQIMERIVHALRAQTRITHVETTLENIQKHKLYTKLKIKGVVKTISPILQGISSSMAYQILVLADAYGSIQVYLNSEQIQQLEQLHIEQYDSILLVGELGITKARNRNAQSYKISKIDHMEKIAPLADYKKYTELVALDDHHPADVYVKVLDIHYADTSNAPHCALVEDEKATTVLKYWNLDLKVDKTYAIYNLQVSKKQLVAKIHTTVKPGEQNLYTYLSAVRLTSVQGLVANLVYNFEAVLSFSRELSYIKNGEQVVVYKYLFKTTDDDGQLQFVDWGNYYASTFEMNYNKKFELKYVQVSFYKERIQISTTAFSKFALI